MFLVANTKGFLLLEGAKYAVGGWASISKHLDGAAIYSVSTGKLL